ncbi:glycosyltransferase family 4 protein [Cellvibrio japonicus]|nr:glycosyltransferase family 4 protein [Cellvibrio japonicus]QEI10822.1 glycosyltransferase family 4 protein [Cellvibrio japonicus]QEI14398.1 glycosyltransferase family 4 protein [Cellvibrio japonicus]QEI17976.1 glycosyltransferase family 4 protein [Cellvibrio japonicus]
MSYQPLSYGQHLARLIQAPAASLPSAHAEAGESPLRIALLGYRSHPHVGGQGIYLHYLSKALVDAGHQVDVISGPPYPELDGRVRLIQLPSLDLYAHPAPVRALRLRHLRSFTDTYEWWSKLSGAFGEPYCFGRRLLKYFKRHQPQYDIIHDNQSLCYGLLALQRRGYKVLATLHHPITRDRDLALATATSKGHAWLIRRWYSFLGMQGRVVQQLDHLLTVSRQSVKDIEQAFGRSGADIRVIPNGVDTRIFKPLPAITRIPCRLMTTASSDQPLKGLSILLRACAQLRTEFPALHLLVIGKLKPGGSTEQELQALGLNDSVQFVSGISTEQMVEEYARASIAVVPSLYEGFGLPAAEAMACGIPLVCSDGGALPEVTGEAARLVAAGDVDALVTALRDLLTNPSECTRLGQAGREHILQQLSWDCVARQMENYYRELLRQGAANAHH